MALTIELVEGAVEQGEKVIVFSCFDEPLKRICRHFGEALRVFVANLLPPAA